MSTNIKSIRIYLPATEDREELDVTDLFDGEGGFGKAVGFDGITAECDERLERQWSLMGEPTGYNPYPDGVTISGTLGYNVAETVLAYIEEHDGPMTRLEDFDPHGFAIVFVEDGAIDVDFISYDDAHNEVRFEAITNALGLTLNVELLDPDELGEQGNPRAIDRVEGKIIRADGTSTQFSIVGDDGYQQWGGTMPQLSETVDLLSAMSDAAREHFPTDNEE